MVVFSERKRLLLARFMDKLDVLLFVLMREVKSARTELSVHFIIESNYSAGCHFENGVAPCRIIRVSFRSFVSK